MRAVVLTEQRPELELVELPDPEPGPEEVLVRVTGCGICGSDLHVAAEVAPPGMVFGHEIAGVVEAFGPGVAAEGWHVGDPVALRPFAGCGSCRWCVAGRADHCDAFELLGLQRPGGFAELVVGRADELHRLPGGFDVIDGALVEPLAVARRAVRRSGLAPGEDVVVLGGGPIGLAIVTWARHLGARHVTVTEPSPDRRALALGLGADAAVDPLADDMAMLELALRGTAVVFECTGRTGMIGQAMDLAAVDGRVVVVGVCLAHDTTFPFTGLRKELDVRYALYYGREDYRETIDALDAHALVLDGLVEGTVTLDELPDRFAALLAGEVGGKLVVTP